MTEDQVNNFVNGCKGSHSFGEEPKLIMVDYPAYELYTAVLRRGIYSQKGRQLRLVVGKDRRVKEVIRM